MDKTRRSRKQPLKHFKPKTQVHDPLRAWGTHSKWNPRTRLIEFFAREVKEGRSEEREHYDPQK